MVAFKVFTLWLATVVASVLHSSTSVSAQVLGLSDSQSDADIEIAPVIIEPSNSCEDNKPISFPLNETERQIVSEFCNGIDGYINLAWYDEGDFPCNPAEIEGPVPEHRQLSGEFIAWMFTDQEFTSSLARPKISIGCAQISGAVDLSYTEVSPVFWIWNSHFLEGIDLTGAKFDRAVNLYRSKIDGTFTAFAVKINGPLLLRGGTTFKRRVNLRNASISTGIYADQASFEGPFLGSGLSSEGTLFLDDQAVFHDIVNIRGANIVGDVDTQNSTFKGEFLADPLYVGGSVFMRGSALFRKKVDLTNAKIIGNLETDGSIFDGAFDAERIRVGGSVYLRDKAFFNERVNLRGARIEGSLDATKSTFEKEFNAIEMRVENSIILSDGSTFKDSITLRRTKLEGTIDASGSTFEGRFFGDGMQIGGSIFFRDGAKFKSNINLVNSRITGNLELSNAYFTSEINGSGLIVGGSILMRGGSTFQNGLQLIRAHIGGHLQFGESDFDGVFDLTGAHIGNEILISSPSENHGKPNWGSGARLILRNINTRSLQAQLDAWKRLDGNWLETDLVGFNYDRLGGLNAGISGNSPNMADAPASDLIAWIEGSQQDHSLRYKPQPYEQLSKALEHAGVPSRAKILTYAKYEHRRKASDTPVREKILLALSAWFVGHGTRPDYALYWFAGLVLLGMLVAKRSRATELKKVTMRFWYSLENSLPLISLKGSFSNVVHEENAVENFFHAQRVLGFILATILVGSLALLSG